MIEKPPCYGRPCVAPKSPCRQCGVLAACGRRLTQTGTFGLLMFPRIDPPPQAGGIELPSVLLFDEKIDRDVATALNHRTGLTGYNGRVWKWRRERVAVVREASVSRVVIELPLVSPGRVTVMQSARSVQVAPLMDGSTKVSAVTPDEYAARRANATGSIVWAPSWEPVVALVSDIARVVFQGGGSSD